MGQHGCRAAIAILTIFDDMPILLDFIHFNFAYTSSSSTQLKPIDLSLGTQYLNF